MGSYWRFGTTKAKGVNQEIGRHDMESNQPGINIREGQRQCQDVRERKGQDETVRQPETEVSPDRAADLSVQEDRTPGERK